MVEGGTKLGSLPLGQVGANVWGKGADRARPTEGMQGVVLLTPTIKSVSYR